MSESLTRKWIKQYKTYFILLILFFLIQIFLAYKSSLIPQLGLSSTNSKINDINVNLAYQKDNGNSVGGDDEDANNNIAKPEPETRNVGINSNSVALKLDNLTFNTTCKILSKEAISAINRAKTQDCKKHIANIACAIQSGLFYPKILKSTCPNGNFTNSRSLGCYKDEKEYRLLSGYYTNFKQSNSPNKCIQMCLQSGFQYAGVQYGTECFCGNEPPPPSARISDPNCNMKCTGNAKEACGGYFTINIFETGIAKFTAQNAKIIPEKNVEEVRIVFLLTLNGRALRQVHRLIKALYSTKQYFYIHIDSRQDYLYRELLKLETKFPNIRLARKRFSTIWGGASLLTMLLQCMTDLLKSDWEWDFVINLSESDFPVKANEKLLEFLTANKGKNFVKSHGRETQRFIQKQGLDKTFVECDTHMWRIGDRELPQGIQIDGGSDWIALSKDFVNFVTNYKNNELILGLLKIFQHTLLPAESFFHTVLRNTHFCSTYIDNNLHVTNWKRKLGCKCQYKHVVDWCGCSPNDFKIEDWARLQNTESKLLFFARKFEPMINQAIILQLEEWLFGPYMSEYTNLNAYWESIYNYEDSSPLPDDALLTIAYSLLRNNAKIMRFQPNMLKEIVHYKFDDEYKGFIIKYLAEISNNTNSLFEMETRIRPYQPSKTNKNSRFGRRIKSFEVSTDYDQKEQILRNFQKVIGPLSNDPVLVFQFSGNEHAENFSYNLTVLWIDPNGNLADFNEVHVEDSRVDSINFCKSNLKKPITPGIWTVKLIGRTNLFAQTRFLVTPIEFDKGKPIKLKRAEILNTGSKNSLIYPEEWKQYLPQGLKKENNSKRFGDNLKEWIDSLSKMFYLSRESCLASNDAIIDIKLELCKNTAWSSLSPDLKNFYI
ncbi:xylosyltransferase oxt isoform X2 [Condylostylus longicornis]|uniref:xylosyltransferase oxt isoform X2 n=1 Tax=Condylostylus longicornis TaxID=2530218 RepID=UPI00244E432D|nr:xylosyltransferase oxt isoform X2 [Condylostylus longicornis]